MPKKLYPCMLCEKLYAEIEQAEVCERSHTISPLKREKLTEDAREYARDCREGRE